MRARERESERERRGGRGGWGGWGGGEREREREKPEERESCIGKYSEKSATIQSSTGDASASLCDPAHVHDMKDGGCLADLKIVLGTLFVE